MDFVEAHDFQLFGPYNFELFGPSDFQREEKDARDFEALCLHDPVDYAINGDNVAEINKLLCQNPRFIVSRHIYIIDGYVTKLDVDGIMQLAILHNKLKIVYYFIKNHIVKFDNVLMACLIQACMFDLAKYIFSNEKFDMTNIYDNNPIYWSIQVESIEMLEFFKNRHIPIRTIHCGTFSDIHIMDLAIKTQNAEIINWIQNNIDDADLIAWIQENATAENPDEMATIGTLEMIY
jgi:hypothetical protein